MPTSLPSGSLRTMSNRVCAATVVVPLRATCAGSCATSDRSMSVAVRPSRSPSAASLTLDRIGIVVRRSTTFWTWASDRNRAARSMVSFMGEFDP